VAAVDKWGRIGVKTKSPAALIHVVASGTGAGPPLQLEMTGGGPLNALCRNYANGATNGSGLLGRFARGTRTTPLNVQEGDRLGFNIFGG